jgi:hypothetical protein
MSLTKKSFQNQSILVNDADIDEIVNAPIVPDSEKFHSVKNNVDNLFVWDYQRNNGALNRIYDKALRSQWLAADIDWSIDVDNERVIAHDRADLGQTRDDSFYDGTPIAKWKDKEWNEFGLETRRWMLSNFLHGEQAAMICAAKLIETAPTFDSKMFATTQALDEARHADVFHRYISEKTGGLYQSNWHFRQLVDLTIEDSRWDVTYLGMQLIIECLGLGIFGYLREITCEPLLKSILKGVMADEARHVAFGVIALKDIYAELSDSEMMERQEFALQSVVHLNNRLIQQEVYERMGVASKDITPVLLRDPGQIMIRKMLLAKIVPNCSKLGLLDGNNKYLRRKFEEMGIIEFENTVGETEEDFVNFIHQY